MHEIHGCIIVFMGLCGLVHEQMHIFMPMYMLVSVCAQVCSIWALIGECEKPFGQAPSLCPQSCGTCRGYTGVGCADMQTGVNNEHRRQPCGATPFAHVCMHAGACGSRRSRSVALYDDKGQPLTKDSRGRDLPVQFDREGVLVDSRGKL